MKCGVYILKKLSTLDFIEPLFLKLINIGKTVLSPGLSIIALIAGFGSIGLAVVTRIINLIVDLINVFFCFEKLKIKFSFKQLDFKVFKDIFVFSIFIAINQIVDQINWQTDKIILGKMISGTAVSIYAIGSLFNTYFISFSTSISSLFAPQINRIVANNPADKNILLTEIMSKVGRIQFFLFWKTIYFLLGWFGI